MSRSRHWGITGKRVTRGIKLCPSPVSLAPLLSFFHQSSQTEPVINQLAHDKTTTCLPARFNTLPTCHSLTSGHVRSLFAFLQFPAAVDTTARSSRLSLRYRRHNHSLSFRVFLFFCLFKQPPVHHVPPGDRCHSLWVHHAPPYRASLVGHEGK
jgi:hypothetical protein